MSDEEITYEPFTESLSKDGEFLLSEKGHESLHVGWWDADLKGWTTQIAEAGYAVDELQPIAKIVRTKTVVAEFTPERPSSLPIGDIGNTDGSLFAKQEGGKYFWCISTYKEPFWEEISKSLFDELIKHRESLLP